MAFKIIRDVNNRHQTGREIVAVLDSDADLYDLGVNFAPGSTAIVAQQGGNTYVTNASGEWTALGSESGSSGGSGLPSGSKPNQYIVTDGDGNAKWEDKLCWSEDDTVITWDGNTDGLVSIPGPGSTVLYRVSDFIPTGDYRKTIHVATSNGYEYDALLVAAEDGLLVYGDGEVFFALRDNVTSHGFTFPNAGTYFSVQTVYDDAGNSERMYLAEVRVGGTIHLIDKKYLPVTTTFYLDPDKRCVYKDVSLTEHPSENEVRVALSGGIILENLNTGFSARVVSVLWDMGEDMCEIVYIDPEAYEVRSARNGALLDG